MMAIGGQLCAEELVSLFLPDRQSWIANRSNQCQGSLGGIRFRGEADQFEQNSTASEPGVAISTGIAGCRDVLDDSLKVS